MINPTFNEENKQFYFKWFSFVFSILVLFLGLIVLFGWFSNNRNLIQIDLAFVPMQFNAALGFLLSGIGLIALFLDNKRIVLICGILLGLIGILTLFQYVTGVNLFIDEMFMKHYITVQTSHPGRMAPNTAVCFSITALLFIFYSFHKASAHFIIIMGVASIAIFILGLIALLGYFFGTESFYGWGVLTGMAIHTSIGFLFISIAILLKLLEFLINNIDWKYQLKVIFSLGIVFFIDLSVPSGITLAWLYIFSILISLESNNKNDTLIIAMLSIILSTIGLIYSSIILIIPSWLVIVNYSFNLIMIIIITGISYNRQIQKIMEKKLEISSKKLMRSNKDLEQFAYLISHDLQSPLRNLIGSLVLINDLGESYFDDEIKKLINISSNTAEKLMRMITGLLSFSRVDHPIDSFKVIDFNMVIKEALSRISTFVKEKNAKIVVQNFPHIFACESLVIQLFQNLLHNSIKYNQNKHPVIEISIKYKEANWLIEIKDNGVGIAKKDIKNIFDIFNRAPSYKEQYEGTGIGLAIVKKIVKIHSGKIWIESEINQGASFFILLPRKGINKK